MGVLDVVEFLLERFFRGLPLVQIVHFATSWQIFLNLFEVWLRRDHLRIDVDRATYLQSYVEHLSLLSECPNFEDARFESRLDRNDVPYRIDHSVVHRSDEITQRHRLLVAQTRGHFFLA